MYLRRGDDGHELSDDPRRLDLDLMWSVLREQYWSLNVPREVLERSVGNSIPFGLYG